MKSALEIFRGELERLFSNVNLKEVCLDYLGIDPEEAGLYDETKAVFVRRLMEWCEKEKATEALADAVMLLKKGMVDPRVKQIYEARFPVADLPVGTVVDGFEVKEKVKDGGLGSVYRCKREGADAGEDGNFGLKLIHAEHALDGYAAQRFKTLMRILKTDQGPAIQRIEAVGDLSDGRPFVVFPWVEGEPLSGLAPLSVLDALKIFDTIVTALEHVHERGFVHADLNPGNILVLENEEGNEDRREAMLLGFGVDRLFHRSVPAARGTRVYGLFNGLTPEQARGNQPDVRSDIYALGALLFEIVTGKPVFGGDTAIDTVAAHLTQPVPLLSTHVDEAAAGALDDFIAKMLAKEPRQRPQTLDDVRRLLESSKRSAEEIAARAAQTGTREDIELWADELLGKPGDEEMLEALKNEAKNCNAWGAAIEVMEEAALVSDEGAVTRLLLLEAAGSAVRYVKDYDKAAAIYNQLLEADPEDEEVKAGALDLYRAQGRYEELIAELASRAETEEDPEAKLGLIREIGDTYSTNLKEYGSAFDYYLASLTGTHADKEIIEKLETLASRTERFEELAAACGNAAQAAEGSGDTESAVFFYECTGRYYVENIDQPAYALTCFQKVLEYQPGDITALQAMTDLYRSAQQWNELAEIIIHLGEAEQTPVANRDRQVEAAQIHYERLSNKERALELLEGVVTDDPAHQAAVALLTDIYETVGSWEKLAKLLSGSVDALPAGEDQLKIRYQLGELYEDRIDDLKTAREHYEKVLELDSQHLDSIKGLERIYARTGDAAGLRDNLETQLDIAVTPKQQLVLRERLAGIYEEEFKDNDRAIDYLQAIVDTDPEHTSSLIALTRLYRKAEKWEELSEVLEKRAVGAEPEEKKELLGERADVIREKIGDAQRASMAFAEVASLGVDDALVTLARTQEEAGDFAAAIETLRKMIDAAGDLESKVGLLTHIAGIQLDKMNDATEAVATLRKVKDMAPDSREVIAELRRVLVAQGNYAAAMDTLEEELEHAEGSVERAGIFAAMGVICVDNIGDDERAAKYFEQALELDENNLTAGDRGSELFRKMGEWEKALPVYQRWMDAADSLSREKQIELFTQAGEAYTQLEMKDKALKALSRAAEIAGDEPQLIQRLGEVALELENYELAKEQLGKFQSLAGDKLDAAAKVDLLVKLGRACIGIEDYSEAAKLVRQATVMSPDHLDARMLLADVHEHRGDFRGVVDACERVLASLDKGAPERVGLLRRVAVVLFEKLKDAEGAAGMLKDALEIDPEDRTTLGELLKIYSATKQFSNLIDVVLRIAALVDDPGQLARYYLTAAKIYRRELKRPQKAIEYFEMAVEKDPSLGDAQESIVEILTERNDWERLEAHYKKAIARLPKDTVPEEKMAVYKPLADILINKLDRRRDGVLITEAMAKLEPEETSWKEKLVDLYGWDIEFAAKAIDMHRRLLEANPARVDSFRMLYRIFSADEDPDKAWCAAALLSLLNQASPEERTYCREYQPEDLPTLSNRLHAEQWSRLLLHRDMNQTISAIFSVIGPAVTSVKGQSHTQLGLDPGAAIDVASDKSTFAGFVNFAAGALGVTPPPLFYHQGQKTGFTLVGTQPPAIVADRGSSALKDRMGTAFALGQQLTLLYPGMFVRKLVDSGTELSAWLLASIKSFVPTLPVPGDLAGAVSERLAPLRTLDAETLERLQGHVQSFVSKTSDVNMKRWARSVDYTMDRAGLLLCGDVAVAVRMLKTQLPDKAQLADRLRAITLFMISEEHFQLRDYLGTALKNA